MKIRRPALRKRLIGSVLLVLPAPAFACPVCFAAADPRVLTSYYAATAILTLVPLGLIAALGAWLYRNSPTDA